MTQRDVLRPGRVLQDLLCLRFRPFGVGLLLPEFLREGSLRQNEGQQDERSDAHGASCVQRFTPAYETCQQRHRRDSRGFRRKCPISWHCGCVNSHTTECHENWPRALHSRTATITLTSFASLVRLGSRGSVSGCGGDDGQGRSAPPDVQDFFYQETYAMAAVEERVKQIIVEQLEIG